MHSEGPRGYMDMILGDRDNVSGAGMLRVAEGQLSWLQLIPIRNGEILYHLGLKILRSAGW